MCFDIICSSIIHALNFRDLESYSKSPRMRGPKNSLKLPKTEKEEA